MVAPRELARTSWVEGNENAFTRVNDDPSGYVGLLSLCGLIAVVALVALAVGVRVQSRQQLARLRRSSQPSPSPSACT
jgi:hypothetical protein